VILGVRKGGKEKPARNFRKVLAMAVKESIIEGRERGQGLFEGKGTLTGKDLNAHLRKRKRDLAGLLRVYPSYAAGQTTSTWGNSLEREGHGLIDREGIKYEKKPHTSEVRIAVG